MRQVGADAVMDAPKLADLAVEEALVAALLLHEDFGGLEECDDDELFYDHTRAIVSAVRVLRGKDKPCGTVFVLAMLASQGKLDEVEWKGDSGEVCVIDLLSRHMLNVETFYSRQLGKLVRYFANKRKALREAQDAALRTFEEVYVDARKRYEGEM